MIGTIRKHQTWLWAIIITVTIISFVVFFSPYSKLNSQTRGPANYGKIEGETISEEQFSQAQKEVYLQYFFMSGGNWPDDDTRKSGFDPIRQTYNRLLLIHKEDELGIHVASEEAAHVARNMVSSFQKAGITSPEMFVERVLQPKGFQMDDFERFVRHELGIQEMISTIGLTGRLITPQEAKSIYTREHEELATEAIFFSATNYLASVPTPPEAISQFYSNQLAEYRVPERVQVSYVRFDLTNYTAQAMKDMASISNLDERIDTIYQQRGTNYYRDAKSPEEAKQKIRQELIKSLEGKAAGKKANEFATDLFNMEPLKPANLAVLAASNGLPVKVSPPFDRRDGPKELGVAANFVTAAFALTETNNPYAGPLLGEDGVYVIAYDKKLPSESPSLDSIRDRVVADYKYSQAVSLARQAALTFYQTLTNGVAQGKSFTNICAEAKINPTDVPPFSISSRSIPGIEERIEPSELKQLAFSTQPGHVSNIEGITEGAIILFVKGKLPLDEGKMQTDLPSFLNALRQSRQTEAFNAWFNKEGQRAMREIPYLQQQQQQPPSMGSRPSARS
jgi:hypothetical protein